MEHTWGSIYREDEVLPFGWKEFGHPEKTTVHPMPRGSNPRVGEGRVVLARPVHNPVGRVPLEHLK